MPNNVVKLFKVTADYRKNNPNKPHYYVAARTKSEAKKRFKTTISWLDIYDVEICEDDVAKKVMSEPLHYILI